MYAVSFRSENPFDAVPRALDFLRKMRFELHFLAVNSHRSDVSNVVLIFSEYGELTASTFIERLKQTPSIEDVQRDAVSAPFCIPPHFKHTNHDKLEGTCAMD